jgi:hypothetical protein
VFDKDPPMLEEDGDILRSDPRHFKNLHLHAQSSPAKILDSGSRLGFATQIFKGSTMRVSFYEGNSAMRSWIDEYVMACPFSLGCVNIIPRFR